MLKKIFIVIAIIIAGGGFSLLFLPQFKNVVQLIGSSEAQSETNNIYPEQSDAKTTEKKEILKIITDSEPQKPLANPPQIIKAIYATNWSAGNEKSISRLIKLIKETELNSIVIDIKDYTGIIGYKTDAIADKSTQERRIPFVNTLLKRLHAENIYVIGRVAVFEDNHLAKTRKDLALQSKKTGNAWTTPKGISWVDSASPEVWSYNVDIAKDALNRGFDEINFDYIRFPSDGDLADIIYPVWDQKTSRHEVISSFFKYLRQELPQAKLSADFFGLATVAEDDLGIGQQIEDALTYFDYVAPMVYPSHYARLFMGFENPDAHPYEVVYHSIETAYTRLKHLKQKNLETGKVFGKLRPWLQDFNLSVIYSPEMVRAEITATEDAIRGCKISEDPTKPPCITGANFAEDFAGWMLWNPSNIYTLKALQSE